MQSFRFLFLDSSLLRLRKLKIIAVERSYVDVILIKMASQIDIITILCGGLSKAQLKYKMKHFVFRHLGFIYLSYSNDVEECSVNAHYAHLLCTSNNKRLHFMLFAKKCDWNA